MFTSQARREVEKFNYTLRQVAAKWKEGIDGLELGTERAREIILGIAKPLTQKVNTFDFQVDLWGCPRVTCAHLDQSLGHFVEREKKVGSKYWEKILAKSFELSGEKDVQPFMCRLKLEGDALAGVKRGDLSHKHLEVYPTLGGYAARLLLQYNVGVQARVITSVVRGVGKKIIATTCEREKIDFSWPVFEKSLSVFQERFK